MISPNLVKDLSALLGAENVFTSEADRQCYSYDSAVLPPKVPALVLRPTQTEQIGEVVRLCYEAGLAITVRGKGGEHLFPAVDEFLVSLDPAAGEVRVRPSPGMFTPMENGDEA